MTITVNHTIIPAAAVAVEAVLHAGAPDPDAAARRTLAIRELLLQRAGELGLIPRDVACAEAPLPDRETEERIIEQVLATDVRTPAPTQEECRRYYETHPEEFTAGERVEARHILFAIMPGTPVMAMRDHAERTLAELKNAPERFAERAAEMSNCPSGQLGGNLGQFGPGEMVPEFDKAVFGSSAVGVLPSLVATRYGFHIIAVERRIAGRQVPFAAVEARVATRLSARVEERALKQYIEVLAGRAFVDGADLAAAASPLVQ
jgi:peptidyl-prolyl cis-trans isomerase C